MTIKELVKKEGAKTINDWLEFIEVNGLKKEEDIIIKCADYYNLIIVSDKDLKSLLIESI
jgi:hypothetical protein